MKTIIKVFMLALIITTVILLVYTFYTAYFDETKSIVINIDTYGEGNIEAWILNPLVILSLIYVSIDYFKYLLRNEE